MSDNAKLLAEIKKLLINFTNEIKEDNKNSLEILKSEFERKLDIIANIENIKDDCFKPDIKKTSKNQNSVSVLSQNVDIDGTTVITASAAPNSKSKTNITPLIFLQNSFKNSYTTYVDVLFTEDELNNILKHEDLKKCKEGTALYKKKLASLVYNSFIKNDSNKMNLLTRFKDDDVNNSEE